MGDILSRVRSAQVHAAERAVLPGLEAPAGWKFERVDDRTIRITDPAAPFPVLITLGDQAPVMRVMWRLACELMAA